MPKLQVLFFLIFGLAPSLFAGAHSSAISVGAIRWDAWHGSKSEIGKAVERSLSPKQWQWRLPFFAKVSEKGTVPIDADTDEVMTQEIAFAKKAGIDYWAFCAYAPESPMSLELNCYLKNPGRNEVRFCMIADVSHWAPQSAEAEAARFAGLMKLPNYQTVFNGRPLLYI